MSQHWSTIKERGNSVGISLLLGFYKFVGRWLAKLLLYPVIAYFFATGKNARTASKVFFRQTDMAAKRVYTGSENWRTFKHFLSFGIAALDKVDAWFNSQYDPKIEYENYQLFADLIAARQGAVFIGSHLGNLEVCRALGSKKYPIRINVLVFTQHAKAFNQMLQKSNPQVRLNLIEVQNLGADIAIMLKERIEQGEFVVIVGDRTPTTGNLRTQNAHFLGKQALFSQGPYILASLMQCPVLLLFCVRESQHFRVIFEEFAYPSLTLERKSRQRQLASHCQAYADRLAYYATRYPYQWFNFFNFWHQQSADSNREKQYE